MSQTSCRVLTILSATGLLASLVAWPASYWNILWYCGDGQTKIILSSGGLVVERTYSDGEVLFEGPAGLQVLGFRGLRTLWIPHYRHTERHVPELTIHTVNIALPFYTPVLAFSAAIACGRPRHRRPGFCLKCGYNLCGLPEPKCPECGTEFDAKVLAEAKVRRLTGQPLAMRKGRVCWASDSCARDRPRPEGNIWENSPVPHENVIQPVFRLLATDGLHEGTSESKAR